MGVSPAPSGRAAAPAVALALGVLTVGLTVANIPLYRLSHQPSSVLDDATALVLLAAGAAIGTLLAARLPRNPVGWLLLAIFLLVAPPYEQYAVLDYRMHHGSWPLGGVALVLIGDWPIWLLMITCLIWLFPDGQLPARWRRPAALVLAALTLVAVGAVTANVRAVAGHAVPVTAAGSLVAQPGGLSGVFAPVLLVSLLTSLVIWVVVQVPRYRHASRERRQQLKWLYAGIVIFVAGVPLPSSPPWLNDIGELAATALPVCIGIAVLRYRLFEIDRIISRVVSYALITALLAGVFAGLVLFATDVLPFRTPVAVAASTLAAAALFNPLRRRVQRAVDRRFNRARYDAEAVVTAFAERLRHTVDLAVLQDDLTAVASVAFEPAHLSVWLPQAHSAGSESILPAPGPGPVG
jgi:hypothetical protein